jgi:serine/threonine-protein kinase RsbW
MTGRLSVVLANRLPEIARLAGLVAAFGEEHALPSTVIFNLNTSLDEVITNVISYAYDDDIAHEVRVNVILDVDRVTAEVEDDGRAFNPLDLAPPDIQAGLDRRGVGGLGVHIVRSLMDTVEYRRERDRNIFTMSKISKKKGM